MYICTHLDHNLCYCSLKSVGYHKVVGEMRRGDRVGDLSMLSCEVGHWLVGLVEHCA